MSQIEKKLKKLANSLADLNHCSDSRNYLTKSKAKRLFDITLPNAQIYGI